MTTKERRLDTLDILSRELEMVGRTVQSFRQLLTDYFDGVGEILASAQEIDRLEDESDRLQRILELQLMRSHRPSQWAIDCVQLADMIDKIANKVEDAADYLVLTHPHVPTFLVEPLCEIGDVTILAYDALAAAWKIFLENPQKTSEETHRIGDHEERCDQILWEATRQIFDADLELAEKIHLKNLFDLAETISNRVEDAGHALEAFAIRQQLSQSEEASP